MTRLNLKDKIVDVEALFVGAAYQTDVWISKKAAKKFNRYSKRVKSGKILGKKLREWATSGFRLHEGPKLPIRHEGKRVFRIGHDSSLYRLIGFYESGNRGVFIVIDAFLKRKTELSANHKVRIGNVADVRSSGNWRKIDGKP